MTNSRVERIKRGAAVWAGYYKSNPHRFAKDYLHVALKRFQKILIVEMSLAINFVYIASRGQGKTWLIAVFCCIRCILYPGTKICVASGTRGQASGIIEKINLELKPLSPELAAEIDEKQSKDNGTKSVIVFKNGSYIKVVTAGESSRGNRAHILIIDEARLVSKDVIDTILRRFLAGSRSPAYSLLSDDERIAEQKKERNKTIYSSSAYFQDHWFYTKSTDVCRFMIDDTKHDFIAGLPYHLAIKENLLNEDDVQDQMMESDFTEVKWSMEMNAEFWGAGDGSFFDYSSVSKNRHIKYPMLPSSLSEKVGNSSLVKIQPKQNGEKRILSVDVGLMQSTKNDNDASAIFINQLMPTKAGKYSNNIIYTESSEGKRTDDLALCIRRMYDEFESDYIVLDTQGIGLGVFDCLVRDISDPDTGEIYPALSCCNDSVMAARCTVPGADKVIWSIKANASMNSDCAVLLREGFRSGKIRLLVTEYDADELLSGIQGYGKLSEQERLQIKMPYINTTLLINELVKLRHDESSGRVRVYERSGMRKDRYSSLSYNYYVSTQIESKLSRRANTASSGSDDIFVCRPPKSISDRW